MTIRREGIKVLYWGDTPPIILSEDEECVLDIIFIPYKEIENE